MIDIMFDVITWWAVLGFFSLFMWKKEELQKRKTAIIAAFIGGPVAWVLLPIGYLSEKYDVPEI